MKLNIPKDYFDGTPTPPRIFLCTPSGKIINELVTISPSLLAKWNSYSELSFEFPMYYVDIITGETKIHPMYDKIDSPRQVYVQNIGFFILQDIDDTSNDGETKSITAFSAEYAIAGKYLNSFYVNTGETGSIEVTYNEDKYGLNYSTDADSFYKLASGEFDPYESYYQQVYTGTDIDSYTYEQVQIKDATEYATYIEKNNSSSAQPHEKLYMKSFPNVQFYNPSRKELSLLHLVLEDNVPEWTIGNVDQSLWRMERTFSVDRNSIYDFLMNDVADTFGCVFEWDTITNTVNVYEEAEDGVEDNGEIQTRWTTDVFISKDNLASEVKISYSSDNIKTKLVVSGSDNLDIREVNLGRNEIMDLSFYHTLDWMEQDLLEAYDDYLEALQEADTGLDKDGFPSTIYPMAYSDAMKGWVAANNRWNDIMNAVPAEGNVVLVGDEFKKLYCIQSPANTAYYNGTITNSTTSIAITDIYVDEEFKETIPTPTDVVMYVIQGVLFVYNTETEYFERDDSMFDAKKAALIKTLNLYHVDDDTEANKNDNILLKLKNSSSDVVTIRIYDKRKVATKYEDGVDYYLLTDKGTYEDITTIGNETDFDTAKDNYGNSLYTNDYYIHSVVVKASSGISEEADKYPILDWIQDKLTDAYMDLKGYTITYIGTMGAYLVLAKNEKLPENLQDYGVNLLEEKHKIYTTIFQTQTEAMYSQEKYQCIVQDEQPDGDYADGTQWLDTNSSPVVLYQYNKDSKKWVDITSTVSKEDIKNRENYQRYIDNYEKLVSVQSVLSVKEREAEYCSNGYAVSDRTINISLYQKDSDGNMRYNGQLLEEDLKRAAEAHFGSEYTIVRKDINQNLPLYTFTTSFDPIIYGKNSNPFNAVEQYYVKTDSGAYNPISISDADEFATYDGTTEAKTLYVLKSGHVFAVYLKGTTPYVAYANSQGIYQMIMEYIRDKTEMNKFFTVDQWIRLSPFIKEDEFNDSNFLLTDYESEEERIKICQELMEAANKELKTLCKPSLEFSMTMANILALPEFEPLFDQFQLGNFIRVGIRDGYVKRSRLLEVNMNFDDLSDFSCTFGNLVTTKSEVDKHADLLAQAVSAGKTVAKSSGSWQKSVDKTNKLEESINNGLQDVTLRIGASSGQAITQGPEGIRCRKYKDGSTTEYEPEEIMITSNVIAATNDSWRTSKTAFGKYYIDGEERWGPIAEYVTAQTIEGKFISGGSISIGSGNTKFVVNEDGSVEIKSNGTNYMNAMTAIDNAYRFSTVLVYSGLTIFSDTSHYCEVTCEVYDYKKSITSDVVANGGKFTWKRTSNDTVSDATWTPTYIDDAPNKILIDVDDVIKNSQFYCEVEFDETLFTTETET